VLAVGGRECCGVRIGGEQRRRDGVDPAVRGLGGEHGGDQELVRVGEVELAPGVRVGVGEHAVHLARTTYQDGGWLRWWDGLRRHDASVRGMTRL
jgi:hypothetical protein